MPGRKTAPVHPGEILLLEFLEPLGISQQRLARYFGTSDRFWFNLQTRYDLEVEKERLGNRLKREVTRLVTAGSSIV